MKTRSMVAATVLVISLAPGLGAAAEIKVISSVGVKTVLEELGPQFERASEHTVKNTFVSPLPLKRQIDAGETFDVVILTPALVDDLAKQGKIAPGSASNVAKSGIGVAIRQGAPKPDIGSTDAFKKTVLAARMIAY